MTARIRIIRHGEARTDDPDDIDPGLTLAGARQAMALAERLGPAPPRRLTVGPCRRARETALPLSAHWGIERTIDAAYDELPWRAGSTVAERQGDVRAVLSGTWSDAPEAARRWRRQVIDAALAEEGDVAIVSHLVAINVLVGAATGDERAYIFHPGNASITEFSVEGGKLRLVSPLRTG